jgi:hypothetical protein
MWNSPKNRNMQLTPRQVHALALTLASDMEYYLDVDETEGLTFMSPQFEKLNTGALLVKAVDVLYTLVSPNPVKKGGHSAIEEAILHGLLTATIELARDMEVNLPKKEFKSAYLDPVNELIKLAGRKPLKTLEHLDCDDCDIEDLGDELFFWDRDWLFFNYQLSSELKNQLGISNDYYHVLLNTPTRADVEVAANMLHDLIRAGEKKKTVLAKS